LLQKFQETRYILRRISTTADSSLRLAGQLEASKVKESINFELLPAPPIKDVEEVEPEQESVGDALEYKKLSILVRSDGESLPDDAV
jgi:hypothetical protein